MEVTLGSSCSSQQSLPSTEVPTHPQPITCPILASPEKSPSCPTSSPCPDFCPAPPFGILAAFTCTLGDDQFYSACPYKVPVKLGTRRGFGNIQPLCRAVEGAG